MSAGAYGRALLSAERTAGIGAASPAGAVSCKQTRREGRGRHTRSPLHLS